MLRCLSFLIRNDYLHWAYLILSILLFIQIMHDSLKMEKVPFCMCLTITTRMII